MRSTVVGLSLLVVSAAVILLMIHRAPAATLADHSAMPMPDAGAVTFAKNVAPIVYSNCVTCHRPGQVAPFSLMTYQDVCKHADDIAMVTDDRTMPPWKAALNFGDFVGIRHLTDEQIATIGAWVKAGKPEGNPADLPPAPKFSSGWELGEPDLIVKVPRPFTVPAEGRDVYRCFVIPLNLDVEKYVAAVDFRPSNPRVVHHALFFLDNSGAGRRLESEANDGQPGYWHSGGPGFMPSGGLGGWAPGYQPLFLPADVGRPIRAGADLVIQTHFHPTGKPELEQSTVAIYFKKTEPSKLLVSYPRSVRRIDIPAGDKDYRLHEEFTLPKGVTLEGITPHAHLLCQEIKVVATLPDGTIQPLIWIPKWDWGWQEQYQYQKPLSIPAGTKVDIDFRYDNSADNPRNPHDPPQRVRYGEQTGDEMGIVFFQLEMTRADMAAFIMQRMRRRMAQEQQPQPTTAPAENR
jgi:mono/diheme cytochrome c family protein